MSHRILVKFRDCGLNQTKADALIKANIAEALSLDEIVALVGVSRRQIERRLKRYCAGADQVLSRRAVV